jgi:hypothetical protein
MRFWKIKIGGNTLLILLILYLFGYTHLLGGPFWLAKFFFVLILAGALAFWLVILLVARLSDRIFKKQMGRSDLQGGEEGEKIKVDAKIIE